MQNNFHYQSAEEALMHIKSGDRIFIQGSAATPNFLLNKLTLRANELTDIEMVCVSVKGEFAVADEKYKNSFYINSFFASEPVRKAIHDGRGDFVPVFLSEIPELFRENILPLDVALVQVSPPDMHGYCSLGVSVDVARQAVNSAKIVIAQVNPQMPRTHGDGFLHVSAINSLVFADVPLYEEDYSKNVTEIEIKLGKNVAEIVDDRATLQLGIGTIPDAVLLALKNHKDLGLHTEMFSNGVLPLIESGAITNKYKVKHPGKVVAGFCVGTRKLFDYIDDNPLFAFLDIDYVNDPSVIRQNPKVHAINSCIEIDLTGQVCSDSIGTYQYSGVGGQMDFMRGAALSEGGKPIIATTSRTGKGIPRIVPFLKQGGGVVTTRAHVHYVVTEYGVANLYGKNLRQRAQALINIAHPEDKEMLERACHERFKS